MKITEIKLDEPWDILDSGSVIHYDNNKPITFTIIEKDGTPINIRFEFLYKKALEKNTMEFVEFDEDTLLIKINHSGNLSNYGILKPIDIGSFNGRDLLFNYRVDLNNNEDSVLLNITWYLKKTTEL